MTWVLGSPSPFGYAVGLADIQVTWDNGSVRKDCLRKIYRISPFVVAGFSGSVRIGFDLLEDLTRFLPRPPHGSIWSTRWVAWKWWRRARRIFCQSPAAQKRMGSSILLLGASADGSPEWMSGSRADVIVLSSVADFSPSAVRRGEVGSIGSGNNIDSYRETLRALPEQDAVFWHGEINSPGGAGRAQMWSIARFVYRTPEAGISRHLHFARVASRQWDISPLDLEFIDREGISHDHRMPEVASGRAEFEAFAISHGLTAAEASA